jgi:hypothetical protein
MADVINIEKMRSKGMRERCSVHALLDQAEKLLIVQEAAIRQWTRFLDKRSADPQLTVLANSLAHLRRHLTLIRTEVREN